MELPEITIPTELMHGGPSTSWHLMAQVLVLVMWHLPVWLYCEPGLPVSLNELQLPYLLSGKLFVAQNIIKSDLALNTRVFTSAANIISHPMEYSALNTSGNFLHTGDFFSPYLYHHF